MLLIIPRKWEQMMHVTTAVMKGIHEVFPTNDVDSNDPISLKKMQKRESQLSTRKTLLGFDFDGKAKTI
jgi:hypothetical protein